jgi:hypothetical protein
MTNVRLTNEQKTAAVGEAFTQRTKAREHYATLADAGDEHARNEIRRIDLELGKLRAETVGVLPGESKYGSTISLDVGGIADVPRFRFEDELGAGQVEFRSARLR